MSGRGKYRIGQQIFVANDPSILDEYGFEVKCTFATFNKTYEKYKNILEILYIVLESSEQSCQDTTLFLSQLQSIEIDVLKVVVKPFEGQTRVLDISQIAKAILTAFTISYSLTFNGFNPNYVIMKVPEIQYELRHLTIKSIGVQSYN